MATAKTATKKTTPANDDAASALPVFFKKPHILDAKRHAKSGVSATTGFGFAQTTNSIPLSIAEFVEAAKSYPIVFAGGEQMLPAAVLGLEQANYFVNKKGEWLQPNYVPAHARQYPFIFFEQPAEDRFFLCVDEAAPHFQMEKDETAQALYNADGTPSDLGKHALEFCTDCYRQHLITRNFCDDLIKHKLLAPFHSEATLNSGKKMQLSGFQMIDEAAVNALPEDVYLEFRQKGWLPAIHFALASVSNWKRLVDLAPQA